MAIPVTCTCGKSFDLKNEYAGQQVACPVCRGVIQVPAVRKQADPAFDRDKFLMRQKRIALNEKYIIHDEQDRPILFVERPTYLLRSILAALGVVFVIIAGVIGSFLVMVAADNVGAAESPLAIAGFVLALLATLFSAFASAVYLFPKRHVTFWRDKSREARLLEVKQDKKLQLIKATFTVIDPEEGPIAMFSKNIFTNILRKCWRCTAPDGTPVCCAYEDSIILALLRRFLGTMMGLLRTNFLLVEGNEPGGRVLGAFNRKFTLFDRYVLDLTPDSTRSLDRRVALALGVMLDTGERR